MVILRIHHTQTGTRAHTRPVSDTWAKNGFLQAAYALLESWLQWYGKVTATRAIATLKLALKSMPV